MANEWGQYRRSKESYDLITSTLPCDSVHNHPYFIKGTTAKKYIKCQLEIVFVLHISCQSLDPTKGSTLQAKWDLLTGLRHT